MTDDPISGSREQPADEWVALSSLADGEATAEAQERCLALWAEQGAARERWRQYQLIGDVLRSQELARDDAHDAAFLSALRARLAREPALLRPVRTSTIERLRTWAVPLAATAGVAVVAGVAVLLRSTPAPLDGAVVAGAATAGSQVQTTVVPPVEPMQRVNGQLIRDARLDRYFAAHRQSGTGTAVQMPGGVVRSVDTIVLEDR